MAYGTMSIGGLGMKTNDDFIFDQDGTMKINKLTYYPVGSIYQSINPTSPAELFGGTWESIASNRVLMGTSEERPADSTIEAGLPNITGRFALSSTGGDVYTPVVYTTGAFSKGSVGTGRVTSAAVEIRTNIITDFNASTSNPIYGNSSTVQPPAYYVYMWKRIS